MGSSQTKEEQLFKQLTERPLSQKAYVVIGRLSEIKNFRGSFIKEKIKGQQMYCSRCKKYYDRNSIRFFLNCDKSICFVCYTHKRVYFLLHHSFLCRLVLGDVLPGDLHAIIIEKCIVLDDIGFQTPCDMFQLLTIPSLSLLYPYLPYNILKHIESEFIHFYREGFTLCDTDRREVRIRLGREKQCYEILLKKIGEDHFSLYAMGIDYYDMMRSLHGLLKYCLSQYEYMTFYPRQYTQHRMGIAYL